MLDYSKKPFYLKDEDLAWIEITFASMTQEEKLNQVFVDMLWNDSTKKVESLQKEYQLGGFRYNNAAPEKLYEQNMVIKLEVLSVTPQSSLKNLWGRSVRLDAFCKLGDGRFCNIEVQKSDNTNHVKRVRYNASCITANNTEVGADFIDVPDVTMVYISTFDMFNKGKTIYHCRTVIEETNEAVDNGLNEIYVNTAINDGSTIAELMECFLQEQVNNRKFPLLSNRVWYYKNDEGGLVTMCQLIEDYAKECIEEQKLKYVLNMHKAGLSIEQIAEITEMSLSEVKSLLKEV